MYFCCCVEANFLEKVKITYKPFIENNVLPVCHAGSSIDFSGIDLVDGTPVLDIKPYIPQYDLPVSFRGISDSQFSPTFAGEAEWSADMHQHPFLHSTSCVMKKERKPTSDPMTNTVALEGSSGGSKTEVFDSPGSEPDTCSVVPAKSLMGDSCPSDDCKFAAVENKKEKHYLKETMGSQVSELKSEQQCLTSMKNSVLHDDMERGSCVRHSSPFSGISECLSRHLMPSHTNDLLPVCEQTNFATLKVCASCGAEQRECKVVPDGSNNTSIARDTTHTDPVFIANWLASPPVSKLHVSFTEKAEADLKLFSQQEPEGTQTEYKLDFFSEESEIRDAIVSVLQEDPRSVYRREKCQDALYFFTVDRIHITCSFHGDHAEVLKLQPISWAEKLKERPQKL